jgi:TonB family protein
LDRLLLVSFFIALFLHFSLAFTDPGIFKIRPAFPEKRRNKVIAIELIKPPKPPQSKKTVSIKDNIAIAKEAERKVIKKREEKIRVEAKVEKKREKKEENISHKTKERKKAKKHVQEVIKKIKPLKPEKRPLEKTESDIVTTKKNDVLEKKDIVPPLPPRDTLNKPKTMQPVQKVGNKINQPEDSLTHTQTPVIIKAVPKYKENRPPAYPRLARKRGYQGRVVLGVLVKEDGSAGTVRLEKSSGHTLLDEAAIEAVKKWLFSPGKEGDKVVEMWVKIPVRFRLK